jgi:hypothetical protein
MAGVTDGKARALEAIFLNDLFNDLSNGWAQSG